MFPLHQMETILNIPSLDQIAVLERVETYITLQTPSVNIATSTEDDDSIISPVRILARIQDLYGDAIIDMIGQSAADPFMIMNLLNIDRGLIKRAIIDNIIVVPNTLLHILYPSTLDPPTPINDIIEDQGYSVLHVSTINTGKVNEKIRFTSEETNEISVSRDPWPLFIMIYLARYDSFAPRIESKDDRINNYLSTIDSRKIMWKRGTSAMNPRHWNDIVAMVEMVDDKMHMRYFDSIRSIISDMFGVDITTMTEASNIVKLFIIVRTAYNILTRLNDGDTENDDTEDEDYTPSSPLSEEYGTPDTEEQPFIKGNRYIDAVKQLIHLYQDQTDYDVRPLPEGPLYDIMDLFLNVF